jgi:GntR family transcriptional regulator/MocR family aminotransferase
VRCEWEQVAITSGSQQALHALAQLLLTRGDRVLMEDPGYSGAKAAWRSAGARIVPAAVDHHGMVLPTRGPAPRLSYLTPSRQFPTGASMPVSRRLEMLEQVEGRLLEAEERLDYTERNLVQDAEHRRAKPMDD